MKLPRDLTGAEIVRALRRIGFVVERQRGSHIRLAKGTTAVTVPNHHPVKPGTLASILRQAGVTVEELRGNL